MNITHAVSRNRIRTMVVDDSAVVRGLIRKMIEDDPEIEIVASCGSGALALQTIAREKIDVVVLDIEMPVMDGLETLKHLLQMDSGIAVIIASTLSQRNAEISLRALELGALDYIPKPSTGGLGGSREFQRELLQKIRSLGAAKIAADVNVESRPAPVRVSAPIMPAAKPSAAASFVLRQPNKTRPRILAIGSSTGGPQALFTVLKGVHREIDAPIVITQHMPPTFTSILAEHITRTSGWPCKEAQDGDVVMSGKVYVAPGNYHMTLDGRNGAPTIRITQDAPENFCRPSVDPMMRSLARIYGGQVLALILTGMGSDGLKGVAEIVNAGGNLIAQDERTSVVWGMPGSVAMAGLCSAVLPLPEIAEQVNRAFLRSVS